ncbi:MAG: hypothetical protein EBV20_00965 [Betaproteobacteria bacterium]|jgi:hypothetical protein|nr:hypothetical protein [Betaproteobacteria bacterium]NBP44651.1 hypothetical protein [Betaproteobacteria bacterium]
MNAALLAPAQTAKALRKMRMHLAVCVVVVLASGAGIWAFHSWRLKVEVRHKGMVQATQQAKHRLGNSDQELKTIQALLPRMQSMIEQGRYGDPLRLDWVEAIEHMPKRLPGVVIEQYQISPLSTTLPFTPPESAKSIFSGAQLQKINLNVTEVTMNVQLVHEGDLLAVLRHLQDPRLGFSTLRSCDLKALTARSDRLVAHCELYWLTLKHSADKTP